MMCLFSEKPITFEFHPLLQVDFLWYNERPCLGRLGSQIPRGAFIWPLLPPHSVHLLEKSPSQLEVS